MAVLHHLCLVAVFCIVYSCSNVLAADENECELPPLSCQDVNSTEPRVITVLRDGMEVMCDTETDGGGWLVIHRRYLGVGTFERYWEEYKYGFGNLNGDFWFGNEKVHRLTTQGRYELRVDLKWNETLYYAKYGFFRLFGESENYKLEVSNYSGNAGDSLTDHIHKRFSTIDKDNDGISDLNCGGLIKGGWWYGRWAKGYTGRRECILSDLTGQWPRDRSYLLGALWLTASDGWHAIFSEMKIRRVKPDYYKPTRKYLEYRRHQEYIR